MTTFEDVKKLSQIYVCDECKKDIDVKNVILTESTSQINMTTMGMPFIFVDKNGIIQGDNKAPIKGDKLLTCPHCKAIHAFGLSLKGS